MCTVRVTVLDRNDNAPVFDQSTPERVQMPASARPGYTVARLAATDADAGQNGRVLYRLETDPSGAFELDPDSGMLNLARWEKS